MRISLMSHSDLQAVSNQFLILTATYDHNYRSLTLKFLILFSVNIRRMFEVPAEDST